MQSNGAKYLTQVKNNSISSHFSLFALMFCNIRAKKLWVWVFFTIPFCLVKCMPVIVGPVFLTNRQ